MRALWVSWSTGDVKEEETRRQSVLLIGKGYWTPDIIPICIRHT